MTSLKQFLTLGRSSSRRRGEKPRRTTSRLSVERLEARELMAVNAWRDGAALVVQADPAGGTVDVRAVDSTLQVTGPGRVLSFAPSGVTEIRFHGSSRNDTFSNLTSVGSTIYGYSGNDRLNGGKGRDTIDGGDGQDTIDGGSGTTSYVVCSYGLIVGGGIRKYCNTVTVPTGNTLYGGEDDDIITGGSGGDQIYGEGGNDRLYGREGQDRIDGGSGNDGLYGGAQNDSLTGGSGYDRFLQYNGGNGILDANWNEDARIVFSSRHLPWSNLEVEVVDQVFAQLQDRVGGSTWILKDTLTDDPLVFTKVRPGDIGTAVGRNSVSWSPFDYDREITIVDWDERSASANFAARSTMIHEIGHNWDGTSYPFASESNPYWIRFAALHALSAKHPGSSDFVRDYGQTNRFEDWTTTWQMYFGYSLGPARPSSILQAKLDLVDAFFSLPADWL